MSCSTCGPWGNKEQDAQLQAVILKAQAYAKEKNIPVAIFKDEEGIWRFENAFTTTWPLTRVVSQYNNITP